MKPKPAINAERYIEKDLAMKGAEQRSVRDRLGAHMPDELRIDLKPV